MKQTDLAANDNDRTSKSRPEMVTRRGPLRRAIATARRQGKKIGLVPTMGALHKGHLSLIDACRTECDYTVVTIFVNPTQFGPHEDLSGYPRDVIADLEVLRRHDVDLVFSPATDEMYRPGHATFVEVGPLAETLEGEYRPGHFRGVATIVLKLLCLVSADVVYFGRKDYQQSLVVQRMVEDLDVSVNIRTCPIVRDTDGLAMSSRNVYLTPAERQRARALPESLNLAAQLADAGERDARVIRDRVIEHLRTAGGVQPQYVAIVRDGTVTPVTEVDGPTVVAVAVVYGKTRLIDNQVIGERGSE